jgi:hypothetical protein
MIDFIFIIVAVSTGTGHCNRRRVIAVELKALKGIFNIVAADLG